MHMHRHKRKSKTQQSPDPMPAHNQHPDQLQAGTHTDGGAYNRAAFNAGHFDDIMFSVSEA